MELFIESKIPMIQFSSLSNNNCYCYNLSKKQRIYRKFEDYNTKYSCLGGITGNLATNSFDRAQILLLASKDKDGNNYLWLPQEDIEYFLNYIQSLFPIFTWKMYDFPKNNQWVTIELLFKFTNLAEQKDINQMKLILNLIRRVYESPRSYQLSIALYLFRNNWHNLELYQILHLMELTEYSSTNDHKLCAYMPTILPTSKEITQRTTEVNGIYNAHRLSIENITYPDFAIKCKNFSPFPSKLTEELLEHLEDLFNQTNKRRKQLNLHEL